MAIVGKRITKRRRRRANTGSGRVARADGELESIRRLDPGDVAADCDRRRLPGSQTAKHPITLLRDRRAARGLQDIAVDIEAVRLRTVEFFCVEFDDVLLGVQGVVRHGAEFAAAGERIRDRLLAWTVAQLLTD